MEQKQGKRQFSRRDFLKGIPVGIAGAFVIGSLGRILPSGKKKSGYPTFPEGSIFTPARDHTDT